jgi:hypothetical protein
MFIRSGIGMLPMGHALEAHATYAKVERKIIRSFLIIRASSFLRPSLATGYSRDWGTEAGPFACRAVARQRRELRHRLGVIDSAALSMGFRMFSR